MKQVFRQLEDGKVDFADSIVVRDGEAIPEGYVEISVDDSGKYKDDGTQLTPEEIDAIQNAPAPESDHEKIARLEGESISTMLAVTESYEKQITDTTQRETEAVDTMLGLTESYEMIIQQQAVIDALTARIAALEGGGA